MLEKNLDRCEFHPDRPTIGWRDLRDESANLVSTIGVCSECAFQLGTVSVPDGVATVLSPGKPCRCGPGFCANRAELGFIGFCAGSRGTTAPDCAACGAPHQSDAGCWLCGAPEKTIQPWEIDNNVGWLAALAAGVPGSEVFDEQDAAIRRGERPTFAECAAAVIARRRT